MVTNTHNAANDVLAMTQEVGRTVPGEPGIANDTIHAHDLDQYTSASSVVTFSGDDMGRRWCSVRSAGGSSTTNTFLYAQRACPWAP